MRNPGDKVVSKYLYKKQMHKNLNNLTLKDSLLKYIMLIGLQHYKRHYKNQYEFVTDEEANMIVDFLGRFENLERDFREIWGQIGVDLKLPYINKT